MRIVTVVALVAAGMLGVFLSKEKHRTAALEGEISKLRESGRAMEGQVARLTAERNELREEQGLAPTAPLASPKTTQDVAPKSDTAATGEAMRALDERSTQLTEARKAREEMEAQVRQLEARVQALTQESERLSEAEKQLREQTEAATRRAASLENELKSRDERLQKAELSIRELRQQGDERGRRSAQLGKLNEEFDDVNRRRDTYITNVLRRYREVTDLYRTLNLRQEGPREDISRIQNAISLAEDDMRQLQALNAQAKRLQKDLETARK